jgi:hypothetical protein
MTTAVEIIAALDAEIIRIWGAHLARFCPHPKDKMIAERWLSMGATLPMCQRIFTETMEKRHVRNLTIPFSLSYFENMVRDAVTISQEPVPDHPEIVRWKARVAGWVRSRRWDENMWGSQPDQHDTRCPKQVLCALGIKAP